MEGRIVLVCWRRASLLLFVILSIDRTFAQQTQNDLCSSPMAPSSPLIQSISPVREDEPVGYVVGHLEFNGDNNEITTSLSRPNDYFAYDDVSRNITISQKLIAPQAGTVTLNVQCVTKTTNTAISYVVILEVVDVNDHAPVFVQDRYTANISELTQVGTTVLSGIRATDEDPTNWYIVYEIVEGPFSSYFRFPIESLGNIELAKPLDFETHRILTLEVAAKDRHGQAATEHRNSTAQVVFYLNNAKDQNPVFNNSNAYLGYLAENADVGTSIDVQPRLAAYSPDVGLASTLTFQLLPDLVDGDDAFFDLDPVTAELILANNALQRGRTFALMVKVSDLGHADRYATTLVRIKVQAENENAPRFLQKVYNSTLLENTPKGTLVTVLSAIDNDFGPKNDINGVTEGSVIRYRIDPPHKSFTVDEQSGWVQTLSPLDVEMDTVISLTVKVSDGEFEDTAVVMVTVITTNDFNPVFDASHYSFSGKKESGQILGAVEASDADSGSVITYKMLDNSSIFTVDERSGDVVLRSADDVTQPVYTIFVVATDNGVPPRQGSVVVTLTFDVEPQPVVEGETDVVIIIVLAVLAGCLLLIIIILIIYIYRKLRYRTIVLFKRYLSSESSTFSVASTDAATELHEQPSQQTPVTNQGHTLDTSQQIVKSQSFESEININQEKHYNAYVHDSAPEGLAYTLHAHHLAVYDNPNQDEGGTTTQENPFQTQSGSLDGSNTNMTYTYNLRPDLDSQRQPEESTTDPLYASVIPKYQRPASTMNVLDHDTALEPMYEDVSPNSSMSTVNSNSPHMYDGSLSTFKRASSSAHTDSTQHLVTPKGSMSKRGSGSNVSFIDDPTMQVYNPDAAIHGTLPHQRKPGITVFY